MIFCDLHKIWEGVLVGLTGGIFLSDLCDGGCSFSARVRVSKRLLCVNGRRI